MQLVFLASLIFCAATLFKDFDLAKQLLAFFSIDDLLFECFLCRIIKTTYLCNDIIPNIIKAQAFQRNFGFRSVFPF